MSAISLAMFPLGLVVTTPGFLSRIPDPLAQTIFLQRHRAGDWGDLDPEDARSNDEAVKAGDRILSAYTHEGVKFWIITEADRSVTTFLLPEEY